MLCKSVIHPEVARIDYQSLFEVDLEDTLGIDIGLKLKMPEPLCLHCVEDVRYSIAQGIHFLDEFLLDELSKILRKRNGE